AFQDSTPMIVLVGQVARHQIDREAFQEVDFRKMYAPLAKWVTQIDIAERIPELMNQAFQIATSGRPGPVVVALPEDMLRDQAAAAVVGPYGAVRAHPGAADLAEMRRLLAAAERPIMLVGGSGWSDAACAAERSRSSRACRNSPQRLRRWSRSQTRAGAPGGPKRAPNTRRGWIPPDLARRRCSISGRS